MTPLSSHTSRREILCWIRIWSQNFNSAYANGWQNWFKNFAWADSKNFYVTEIVKSFYVCTVKIRLIQSFGGALEPFSGFCSFCSRAPPRSQIVKKITGNKLQIKGFQMMYDSLMWRHWWRHNRIVIYCNFWWVFHAFPPTHINLRP